MQNLNELQHWFGRAIIRRQLDIDTLNDIVVDNEQLSAERRLGVYAQGYQLRLLECMRAEYSCLDALLGRALFDQFALNYLNSRPSTSYTLFDLGGGFPEFLAATRPEVQDRAQQQGMLLPEQLAQLERYRVLSIRGKGAEQNKNTPLDASMLLFQSDIIFQLTDTSFVMNCDFDFTPCIDAVDNETEVPFPELEAQALLVYRQGYRVRLKVLESWQAAFLQGCDGKMDWKLMHTLVSDRQQLASGDLMAQLVTWLPEVVHMGVLSISEKNQ